MQTAMKVSELLPLVREFKDITDSTYKCWLKAARPINDCSTDELTPLFVTKYWKSQLQPNGSCSKATLARRLTLLSGIWALAFKKELIPEGKNYWYKSTSDLNYKPDQEDRYPHRHWDFYKKYHDDPIFLGLWYHGMRIGELCGLMPSEIVFSTQIPYFDIKNNSIRNVKPGSKRQIPIHPSFYNVAACLETDTKSSPGKHWSDTFHTRLNLPTGEASHSIRHRFHSTLRSLEIPDALLDRIVGHRRKSMSDKYGIWTMEHKLKWISKINRS